MKRIIVLGSTGSIGQNALDVIRTHSDEFALEGVAVRSQAEAALRDAVEFGAKYIAVEDEGAALRIAADAKAAGITLFAGKSAAAEVAAAGEADMVVVSLVGLSGLAPTLAAIEAGRTIALATKEVMVAAGELVTNRAREKGVKILPIDSEHSAIFQCLNTADCSGWQARKDVDKLILTASGGPFLNPSIDLATVTPEMALNHPRWKMGPKVTVDSSTMMNKGFEILEARWLFDCPVKDIDVVVHPESIVHSLVTFTDGATLAQLSPPDMRVAIQYALTWPIRLPSKRERLDLPALKALTFFEPDVVRFPCLRLVKEAAEAGGTRTAVLSAADEVAVSRFLSGEIRYVDIPRLLESVVASAPEISCDSIENILNADAVSRKLAKEWKL